MKKKFFVTTAIDYVNDVLHVGHAYQKIVADVLVRYKRSQLGEKNVLFTTGTDEWGQKAEKAAKEAHISNKEYVDKISKADQEQQDSLNISYDRFIRTTDSDHVKLVQEFWQKSFKNGDIYSGEYSGLYCEGCEVYCTPDELENDHCPFHPNLEIKKVSEKNYFFAWSKYKDFLTEHINKNPNFIVPAFRKNEMLEFVKNIHDIPVSRANFKWGIPVPNDLDQVIYVWFDALINYLTAGLERDFWNEDTEIVHILGKDNLRWHALLWPAMLKSAGYCLPDKILVNGFLNSNGQKISKSLGNVIRPKELVEQFGTDAVRYYFLRYVVFGEDADFTVEKLKIAYNADLANGLGNLVARVISLVGKNQLDVKKLRELNPKNQNRIRDEIEIYLKNYHFDQALEHIWRYLKSIDQYLTKERPWQDELSESNRKLSNIIIGSEGICSLIEIAEALQPFLPETAEKILEQFKVPKIKSGPPLFPRI